MKFALWVIYLSVFGGAIGVFAKTSLLAFTPLTSTFLRLLISLVCFALFLMYQRRLGAAFLAVAGHAKEFALLALTGVGFAMIVGFIGLDYTSAINYGLIYNLSPIFIFLFSVLFLKDKCTAVDIIFVILAFLGAGIIVIGGDLSLSSLGGHIIGDILVLISALGWALYSILGEKYTRDVSGFDSLIITFGSFLVSVVVLLPFVAMEPQFGIRYEAITGPVILSTLSLAILSTALLFLLWFYFIRVKGGVWASLVALSENISGVLLPIIFLGEKLTIPIAIGGVLIVGAIAGKEFWSRKQPSENI